MLTAGLDTQLQEHSFLVAFMGVVCCALSVNIINCEVLYLLGFLFMSSMYHKVFHLPVFGCNETYLIISYFLEISNYPPNLAPPRRGLKHNFKEAYVAQISGLTKGFYQDVMKNFVIIKIIFSMYFITKPHNLFS